jgi:hypothetical protein
MGRTIVVATVALLLSPPLAAQAAAPAEPPTAAPAAAPEWTSMSRAKVTSALPPDSPMAADLTAQAPPPQWTDVPLPPPPSAAAKPAPAGAKAGAAAGAAAVAAPAALGAAGAPAPGVQQRVFAAPGAKLPAATADAAAGGPPQGAAGEPQVKFAADQTGAMVTVTQDLESDKLRQSWAANGGQLPAYEANVGMMIMYKDMAEMGAGAYMSGIGFNGGIRLTLLNLKPPKYETRDRSWTAFKIGGGVDLGVMGVTISTPVECYPYVGCVGGPQSASMSSFTLVGTIGFMKAFGSFDSPSDWSGWAIGAEWAPSYQSTTLTMSEGDTAPQTSSDFNATGFALNFESGSMQAMASKMGKKARLKFRLFILPAVGDLPFLMTTSIGAVWY